MKHKKESEIEGKYKNLYFVNENEDTVEVSVLSLRPDDYTYENMFIIKGLENNEVDVYDSSSTVYRFLEDILEIPCKGTQCCHSYDCCGRFYANHIDIKRVDDTTWLCSQTWTRNV